MKKFKLIKEYPGSPKISTEIFPLSHKDGGYRWVSIIGGSSVNCNPEAYPEFWQEVKIYSKIISFRHKTLKQVVYNLYLNGYYTWESNIFTLDYMLSDPEFEIYQVAKSESEIFTIGDNVYVKDHPLKAIFTIDDFYLSSDNYIIARSKYMNSIRKCIDVCLIEKSKIPIFTTEDEVEIFEGDSFTMVQKGSFNILRNCTHYSGNNDWYYLSNKISVEEWIKLNKPSKSIQQILDALDDTECFCDDNKCIFIINMFKKKLDLADTNS
jgi:hypothetical protein